MASCGASASSSGRIPPSSTSPKGGALSPAVAEPHEPTPVRRGAADAVQRGRAVCERRGARDLERVVDEEGPLLGQQLGERGCREGDDLRDVDHPAESLGAPSSLGSLGYVEVVVAEVEDDLHAGVGESLCEPEIGVRIALLEDHESYSPSPSGGTMLARTPARARCSTGSTER